MPGITVMEEPKAGKDGTEYRRVEMGMEMTIGIPARSVKDRSSFSGIWQRDNRLCPIKDRTPPSPGFGRGVTGVCS